MPRHAIATIPISGHTCPSCHRMEHRGLNLTTSSPAFRIPSAHIIFIPSPSALAPGTSMCILCNITVPLDTQESHLSGKRHARIMKHTRGPRACTCPAPTPVLASQPGAAAMKSRIKRSHIVRKQRGRRPRGAPRHKKMRCAQRSRMASLMKIGRSGLFSKYVRDNEYPTRLPQRYEIIVQRKMTTSAMSLSPKKKRPRHPLRRPALLLDGTDLTKKIFTLLSIPDAQACIFWNNALPYFGRYIRRTLTLPRKLALGRPGFHYLRKALATPSLAVTKNPQVDSVPKTDTSKSASMQQARVQKSGVERVSAQKVAIKKVGAQKVGTQKAGTQKVGIQKVGVQKAGTQKVSVRTADAQPPGQGPKPKIRTKPKKKPQQKWHCDTCNMDMAPGSMEDHLQGGRHARKAAKAPPKVKAPAPAPAPQKQGPRSAREARVA